MGPIADNEKENFIEVIDSVKNKNCPGYSFFPAGFSIQVFVTVIDLKRGNK